MKMLTEASVEELGRLLDETSAAVIPIEITHLASNGTLKRKLQKDHKAKTVSLILTVVDSDGVGQSCPLAHGLNILFTEGVCVPYGGPV